MLRSSKQGGNGLILTRALTLQCFVRSHLLAMHMCCMLSILISLHHGALYGCLQHLSGRLYRRQLLMHVSVRAEAQHVIMMEPIFDPAVEQQAVGRIHRIGQTQATTVHRFVVEKSVEQNVHAICSARVAAMDMRGSSKAIETPLTVRRGSSCLAGVRARRLILYSIIWGLSKIHATCDLCQHSSGELVRKTFLC